MNVPLALDTTVEQVIQQIEAFQKLGPNWDSYDADVISPEAIRSAGRFVAEVWRAGPAGHPDQVLPGFVAPLPDGGVQLEWHAAGRALEIEVDADGALHCLEVEGEAGDRHYDGAQSLTTPEALHQVVRFLRG